MFIEDQNDTQVYVIFASDECDRTTKSLLVNFMENDKPVELLDVLEQAGWSNNHGDLMPLMPASPLFGRVELELTSPGTEGRFRRWTADDARTKMAACRKALRKFGFTKVPHWKLTLANRM